MNEPMMFRGQYRFLSNFTWVNISLDGKLWKTAEHMFMACKTIDPEEREAIRLCPTPAEAKRMGRQVTLRPDWDEIKDEVMLRILRLKFQQPDMKQQLLATGDMELVEGNYWHDNYWGSCTCKKCGNTGKNTLGKLLMQVRSELR